MPQSRSPQIETAIRSVLQQSPFPAYTPQSNQTNKRNQDVEEETAESSRPVTIDLDKATPRKRQPVT